MLAHFLPLQEHRGKAMWAQSKKSCLPPNETALRRHQSCCWHLDLWAASLYICEKITVYRGGQQFMVFRGGRPRRLRHIHGKVVEGFNELIHMKNSTQWPGTWKLWMRLSWPCWPRAADSGFENWWCCAHTWCTSVQGWTEFCTTDWKLILN